MRHGPIATGLAACISALAWSAVAQPAHTLVRPPDISFRNEVQHAIDQGVQWLQANQSTNGWWSTPDQPAVTALALSALMGEPSGALRANPSPGVARGYKFIIDHAKPDGSIYEKGLMNYNTSICMMGLMAAQNPRYDPVLRKARQWVIGRQRDGGAGFGDEGNPSDMNNTLTALEALYYSKYLDPAGDNSPTAAKALNWAVAIHFIESCQNLPARNKESWVSTDSRDKGGFVCQPGNSKAGEVTNSVGRTALRSYGSISYAGLLSYVYAGVKPDDPRVLAAYDWLRNNFTLDENPGMGQQGLYYYLHLMTKALTIYGIDQLPLKNGQAVDWRREVAMKLINLQKENGSWASENRRWWEHDPALVTSYCVISLEILFPGL
jgi:squalene-hopene/tetraprenyl-beta-curcumene cyclase